MDAPNVAVDGSREVPFQGPGAACEQPASD
jgi:hypothetical protein